MRTLSILILIFPHVAFTQSITSAQQKALNSYVLYANQSAEEVATVVKSIIEYYPTIHQKNSWRAPRYVCPVQLDEYYFTNVATLSKALNATYSTPLNSKLKDLRSAAEKIDEKCKALDTYHKLEDYKQDNFVKAEAIVAELQSLLRDYGQKQRELEAQVYKVYRTLSPGVGTYSKANALMLSPVQYERTILDMWTFNIKQEVHTGWPVDKLQESILETDAQMAYLKKNNPPLKYPASSMWTSFQGNLGSYLEVKRKALDGYNNEARKSDGYSNEVYLEMINYYNGTLVSDYNTFVEFSERDGYFGLKVFSYVPVYEIRSKPEAVQNSVTPFADITRVPVAVSKQTTAISKPVFESLSNYVEFINETWRQARYMQMVLSSFNSTASSYKNLESFDRRGAMHFDFKDFTLPLSYYQKAVADSKILPPAVAKSLNDQAEVLLNILKEMNAQSALLETEVAEKRYEKDHLNKVYEILERQKVLLDTWDARKELLYNDVRKVYDTYPPKTVTSSWYVSGKALRDLTDLDHDAVFAAKPYYKGGPKVSVSTERIDASVRDVIAKEFDNMKGIEKFGRYNGLCPYTPYEDLPQTSKSLSEEVKKMNPPTAGRYDQPYYKMVYHYNNIVEQYNKFCELSKDVPHLKTIMQPELFAVQYPSDTPEKKKPQDSKVEVAATSTAAVAVPEKKEDLKKDEPVKVGSQTQVVHDTVYIEKRDTIYMAGQNENLRSMEGYATNNMVLLLDVSGSMNSPEKLPLLKESILDLLTMMRPEDEVSIVVFSEKPKVILQPTSFKDEAKIKSAIDKLRSSGKTDANTALKLAYKVGDENYVRGGNNRIILATDGEFNLSDETRQEIERFSKEDIFLSVFNFGKGMGSSKALEGLAALGKGNYQQISKENVELTLIREAKAKKKK